MPNTLAHLFVQGVATRSVLHRAELRWIGLGCVIPDLPWILQRAVRRLDFVEVSPYDLRLYTIVQASLIACLVLCGVFSMFAVKPRRVFGILGFNSAVHLLFDACQTKLGNGVHLAAPFSWELANFGLFWPEGAVSISLTVAGLIAFSYLWWRSPGERLALKITVGRRLYAGLGLLAAYLVLPLVLLSGPAAADNHSIDTLRSENGRSGRVVEFDRVAYLRRDGGDVVLTFAGEELEARGWRPDRNTTISARGTFVGESTVHLEDGHVHPPFVRDASSYVGLSLVAASWLLPCPRRGRTEGSVGH